MNRRCFRFVCRLLALCLGAGAASRVGAQDQLAQVSPFLPSDSADLAGGSESKGGLELRGIMSTDRGVRYCIYDAGKKSSVWAGVGEKGYPFTIQAADPDRNLVTIERLGQVQTLVLHKAKVTALTAGPYQTGTNLYNGASANPVVLRPTPADEQRRLQAIAAEVQRRRMQREQLDRELANPPNLRPQP